MADDILCSCCIPPTDGPDLTSEQARALDDEFFTSRPLAYFSARIEALLEQRMHPEQSASKTAFLAALGNPEGAPMLVTTDSDRRLQVAIDSLSTRHHVAEALVRLLHALTDPAAGIDESSTWSLIAEGPNRLHAVATTVSERLATDQTLFSSLFFPRAFKDSQDARMAFNAASLWVRRATLLVTSNDLTVNAAHNKVKHGLAVRARDDRRVDFIAVKGDIRDKGNTIPLSTFDGAMPIIDKPEVGYLVRPYSRLPQGLEVTSLVLDAPVLLAEAWMVAVVHAALFHVAATKHFKGRNGDVARYPTLPKDPTPAQVLAGKVEGFREVLTTPKDASVTPRRSGLFHDGTFRTMDLDHESMFSATVVEG